MIMRLAERLEVPPRARSTLLNAAGFAQVYPERSLDDPGLSAARQAIDLVLTGHEPNPALAVDRHWTLAAANRTVAVLLTGIDPVLPRPPVNVPRLSLHPAGLAPRIVNFAARRAHLLERLRQQIEASSDGVLVGLLAELRAYPAPAEPAPADEGRDFGAVAVLFRLATDGRVPSFLSTTTVFGTPVDISLPELPVACFFSRPTPPRQRPSAALRPTDDALAEGVAPVLGSSHDSASQAPRDPHDIG